ncbi:hypothetical protein LO763_10770 [Glycomyces sp. A-F 0318]|nr:hypothetical protein [Glycomyces amatae]MCD0444106.1 hypothetical protein [Glycomyces amatae]
MLAYTAIAAKPDEGRGRRVGFNGRSERAVADRLRGFGMGTALADETASL